MRDNIAIIMLKKDLRDYYYKKLGLPDLNKKIENLKENKYSPGGIWSGTDPVKGGGTKQEDKLLEINAKLCVYEKNYKENIEFIDSVEKALESLNELESKIIYEMWISDTRNGLKRLCKELNYSKSSIYNISDNVLYKMAVLLYGKVD